MIEWIENISFLGLKLINVEDLAELVFRFLLNTIMLLAIVSFPYLRHSSRRNYTFSFIAVGTTVFLLCFLLNSVKLELGFALGLFAIFGIIRYRTDAIPFKQMTYLFVVIGLSVMNALANKKVSYAELLFTNIAIITGLWILEKYLTSKHEGCMKIVYENIANIHTEKYDALMQDLKARTGFEIKHFEIQKIDYLKDTAVIMVYFTTEDNSYSEATYEDREE
ncbi:MAG: DUF4956 domain-containing protein [Rikenellaceae bacterium]